MSQVSLIVGHKGTGKTKMMIDRANDYAKSSKGSVVFVNKNHRLTYDLIHEIRIVCMEDYEEITNSDEYVGFLYGIISGDHDIEAIFIDSILKHADVHKDDIPEFLARLKVISNQHEIDFVVSLSADLEELSDDVSDFTVLIPDGCGC